VSIDWGIINKQAIPNQNNVFALFLDLNTGLVFVFPSPSRGLAGTALLAYIQRYGQPLAVRHDNAQEFIAGEFADICSKKGIQQNRSAPFNPNQNPVAYSQHPDLILQHIGS
jgi:transposase InsO family protein